MKNYYLPIKQTQEIYYSLDEVYDLFERFGVKEAVVSDTLQNVLPLYQEAMNRDIPARFRVTITRTPEGGILLIPTIQIWVDGMKN